MSSLCRERSAKQIFQMEKVAWDEKESELRKEKFSQITQKKRWKERKVKCWEKRG